MGEATSTGCRLWLGKLTPNGYGRLKAGGVTMYAHRVSFRIARGIWPSRSIDHLCRNTACVNPDHLEDVAIKENILRGTGPAANNARKEECKRGHRFDQYGFIDNVGARQCKLCCALRTQLFRERHPDRIHTYIHSEQGRENARLRQARWRQAHPESVKAYERSERGYKARQQATARYRQRQKENLKAMQAELLLLRAKLSPE